jgi:outer membrane protein TolC
MISTILLGAVLAASPAPREVALTLADATERALARNHAISLDREGIRQAGEGVERALAAWDPGLRVDARYRERADPVNSVFSGAPPGEDAPYVTSAGGSAGLQQLLPTGGTLSFGAGLFRERTDNIFTVLAPSWVSQLSLELRQPLLQNRAIDSPRRALRVARLDRDRSLAALRRTVSETVAAVERAYWTLVAARRDLEVRRGAVTLAEEQGAEVEARIGAGTLSDAESFQPKAEIARRLGDVYASEEAVARAENQLKALILDEAEDPLWNSTVIPADPPETALSAADAASAIAVARVHRPELEDARFQFERTQVDLDAAKDRLLPQLDLVGAYARRGLAGDANPLAKGIPPGTPVTVPADLVGGAGRSFGTIAENRFPDASIGIALTLPLGNRAARAEASIARGNVRRSMTALKQLREQIVVEVRNAVQALATSAQRIEAARLGRAAAEEQLRAERERYASGLSSSFLVLTRQNDLAMARMTQTAALTDGRKALTELARTQGTLLTERRIEILDDLPVRATAR